jgi:uncharacterized membrane protein
LVARGTVQACPESTVVLGDEDGPADFVTSYSTPDVGSWSLSSYVTWGFSLPYTVALWGTHPSTDVKYCPIKNFTFHSFCLHIMQKWHALNGSVRCRLELVSDTSTFSGTTEQFARTLYMVHEPPGSVSSGSSLDSS